MRDEYWLTMKDGHEVFVAKWWDETKEPRAIIQLSHGMAEHIKRYEQFAQFLVSKGIFLVGNDHRGHGRTGEKSGNSGYFAELNGFEKVVEDLKEVNNDIQEQYPLVPKFLMGHSMGSFLVRRFIQRFQSDIRGVILSGTGGNSSISLTIAKIIAKSQIKKFGSQAESKLLNQLTTGSYNKKFVNAATEFEWLSRDQQRIKNYIEDTYCGKSATTSFYYDLYDGLHRIQQDKEVIKVQKNLPFYLFSGDMDPVGNYSKGVTGLIRQLQKHGITEIDFKIYKDGRHEMLNEVNRDEVFKDLLQWLEKQLSKK
ncbi:alpha/beta hydrolase [Bacillus sp. AFS040349]|uniref:alpha/beta hydrolase n=1 Tax=Bacillus sp. AFS040349 TaxID=2033502 RepID=UPI000BFE389C|nr:alpha/beta hydrolase [Bacillus sp. AFS040349]PGT76565.1 alpha/beta hydrolase [Bacillus sp. AFS040349]